MTNKESLNHFLQEKIKRQTILNENSKKLEELDFDIVGSKFNRWFNSSYLRLKRTITLIVGILFMLFSLWILVFPEAMLKDEQLKQELIKESRKQYAEMAGETLNQTLIELATNSTDISVEEIIIQLDRSIDKTIEKEIISTVRYFAVLVLTLAIFLLYISRLTLKSRRRNRKISDAETVIQDIIQNYRTSIEDGEKEILALTELVKEKGNAN